MTADVNADFQSRPVIITRTAWPPGIVILSGLGAYALNPEHRRAKPKIYCKELFAKHNAKPLH
jgi:hypothetical protein